MKRKAFIFDVDGTVAQRDMGPDGRSPYDMTRVGEDTPNQPILTVARLLESTGMAAIIFTSGRDETARYQTELWLNEHYGYTFELLLRKENDNRPDETFKQELLDKLRMDYDIIAAFDDRDRVVKMWRDNGITCLQVAPGGF